jgi:hypothetical protein
MEKVRAFAYYRIAARNLITNPQKSGTTTPSPNLKDLTGCLDQYG